MTILPLKLNASKKMSELSTVQQKTEVAVFGKRKERQKISVLLEREGLTAEDVVKNLGVLIIYYNKQ